MRLNKYLAQCGICSRRDADKLIEEGRVFVNGRPAVVGQTVCESDHIRVGKKVVEGRTSSVVLACYKPVGVTCTERDAHADRTISDVFRYPVRVTYAGRLDKDSEGLLLLTNDGELIDHIMRGINRHEKEYVVKVNREITDSFVSRMEEGVLLKELEVTTRPCKVIPMGKYTFKIILTQGLNRQIRRMCKTLGYTVQSIKRIRIMNIMLGDLKPGAYRELTPEECAELYRQAGIARRED